MRKLCAQEVVAILPIVKAILHPLYNRCTHRAPLSHRGEYSLLLLLLFLLLIGVVVGR